MLQGPTDDFGLADAMAESYEIISATNTDTEDQDDHYSASISESVASLDFHRPDDVHSLAGTEHTYDEEESVPDDDSYRAETPFEDDDDDEAGNNHDGDDDDDDGDDYPNNSNFENRRRTREDPHGGDGDGGDDINESTFVHSQTSDTTAVESLPDSDDAHDEARSLSSLQYTQQSLGTPSLPTTEANRIFADRPPQEHVGFRESWNKKVNRFWEVEGQVKDYCMEFTSAALPGMMFVLTFALVLQLVHSSNKAPLATPAATPVVATMTTTATFTTTATTTATATHSVESATSPQPTSAPSGGFGLIPVGGVVSDDWLFGANKPVISFAAQSHHGVLVRIPAKIKKTWQTRGCLTLTARRGDELVDTVMSSVDEGIVVKFAKREVHGVVTLFLEATCRPKVHKTVKVHFSKGLVEGALDLTKNLAQDLSKLVPATAQEAERRLGDAKRSLDSVCQNVCGNLQSASETVAKTFGTTLADTRQNLEGMASEAMTQVRAAREQVAEQLSRVQDLQDKLQLYLLDAQISAKLWWLQTTGSREKRDDYQRKAESFVAQKQATARELRGAGAGAGALGGRGREDAEAGSAPPPSFWARRKLGGT
ncbi:hypothetical protein ESCO_004427 [Escovopsis weberi]|uniref:Uncharacterized protein n=1 Tax=Escovopsis weberi TaxID=150374 RepID=A0A0M8N1K5_ESCWE|nr:hypothetical protein ESCO_004427 [Escovopsis weberi]